MHGRKSILGMFNAFAAPPTFRAWRIDSAGDIVLVHAAGHYPGLDPLFVLIEYQFDGALIVRETAYFGAAFTAADWRRPFVKVERFT